MSLNVCRKRIETRSGFTLIELLVVIAIIALLAAILFPVFARARAIGAQVRLFWNGQQQLQEVSGASGFCAQNQRRLHFGLGKNPNVEKALIRWPSGKIMTITQPQTGKIHRIKETA